MLRPDADIIIAIHKAKADMKAMIHLEWIRGHQDKDGDKRKEDQPYQVQTNIELDEDAGMVRLDGQIEHDDPYPGSGAMLIIGNK